MLSNKKTEKFFLKDMRTEGHVFGERQNSSGGLRPPQQSMIQTLLFVMMICIRLADAEAGDLRYLYSRQYLPVISAMNQ